MVLRDSYYRQICDLRVSLTESCNFRCVYCHPISGAACSRSPDRLSFAEIERVCRIFVRLGITKIRLTGGEPLVRKGVESLVSSLAALKGAACADAAPSNISTGLTELAMITNGSMFAEKAELLRAAGLDRVTFSLDSLRPRTFREITGVDNLHSVLSAINVARHAGFQNTKVNAVVIRGRNDDEVVDLAQFARDSGLTMRFIEFMPLDGAGRWTPSLVVTGEEIRKCIDRAYPLRLIERSRGRETAWRYSFADGAPGEIGIITPISDPFCGACSRIRLTADGKIRTCLFSDREHDLKPLLRNGADDDQIAAFIRSAVRQKEYGKKASAHVYGTDKRSMVSIGG